jgi:hypothetical protein
MVRSSVRPIVRSFVRSFVQIIFFLPLCCRNSNRSFVRSFDRSSDRSIVRPFVGPNNLFPAVMLPKFRSFDHSIVHRSFIAPIHRSSFVHTNYSPSLFTVTFIVTIYRYFLPLLFTVTFYRYFLPLLFTVTFYRYFLPLLFTVTIYRYFLPLLFTVTFYRYYLPSLFTVTIYHYYSPLLFIDHPITPNFNYSSIMLSSPPKTSQTHIPVIQTSVIVIFLPVETSHLVTHPRFLQVEHA